ncbi:hypothetical protein ADN00_16115 [Ornatilinea apprima]|uniref:Glycoside hydrolase family 42 N-terminal domain-containing protein n=1 Tax=Ornatilinea apprima TaxID=1134406 RepID=A0A0P6WPM5_9CHLR|nr:hypothetical protein [Ornatilinea apprima]KPL72017.1 hypothetical protein ADN00_16115 [Ornatilinea apprima]
MAKVFTLLIALAGLVIIAFGGCVRPAAPLQQISPIEPAIMSANPIGSASATNSCTPFLPRSPTPTATFTPILSPTATPTSAPIPASPASPRPVRTSPAPPSTLPEDQESQPHPTDDQGSLHPHPFYGMEFVPTKDFETVRGLGIEVIGQTFAHDGSPASWKAQLDLAEDAGLRVIAWLWPQGWTWEGDQWVIDEQARSFLETVAGNEALFAVYVFNEPYWQECWGCGYTTSQQQKLYSQIKAIRNVPIFSAVDSMRFWTDYSPETAFADGICDYCATWYYPVTQDGFDQDELRARIAADLSTARQRAPKSKIVWYMQAFAGAESGYRVPTANEMEEIARIVYEAGVDGAMWYVWSFNSLYNDTLCRHPELFATVRKIYEETVLLH